MKLVSFLCLAAFVVSCASKPPEDESENDPKPGDQPEVLPELPLENPDEDLEFVDPNTTGELMKEEDKKTVSGPVPVTPPEPSVDSTIEIKTPPVPDE